MDTVPTTGSVAPDAHVPSHPEFLRVCFSPGDFMSSLHSIVDFKAGDSVCLLTGCAPGAHTRTSFQCGEGHFEFNNDVVFANHSCDPNIALDLSWPERAHWRVVAIKDIAAGDELTWFYPDTEWDAWAGGFGCNCGSKMCIRTFRGSKALSMESLSRYPSVAPHILRLAANRDRAKSASAPLKIAYVFDRRSDYLALGFSKEQCEELDSDHTIDCVAVSLRNLGEVELVGSFPSLVSRLAAGAHKQWDLVFNYAKGFAGREAQTPSLLEAFRVSFTLSGSAAQTLCLDRCRTKMVLQFFGIPTAPLAVDPGVRATTAIPTNYTAAALQASPHIENFALPYVAKPSVEGISKKIIPASGTDTHLSSQSPCVNNIVEMHLEGREFCVGILGTGAGARVIGVVEYVFENGDLKPGALLPDYHDPGRTSFIEVINCDMTVPIFKAVAGVGLKAWRAAGCSDAGYVRVQHDVRGENARPCVLEINAIPDLTPDQAVYPVIAQKNGIPFDQLIAEIVNNALKRVGCT